MTFVRATLSFAILVSVALSLTSTGFAQTQQSDIYFASEIWTGVGAPIEDAAMLVVDGEIVAIGSRSEIQVPAVATQHQLGSQIIIPGLVAVQTSLSGNQSEERTLTPGIRAIDGFDFFAERDRLLESGVTTAQISPSNSRLLPGIGGVVQLDDGDILDRILSEQESLRIVLSESARNPPRIYEPAVGPVSQDRPLLATRPQLAKLSSSLAGLRQIFKRAKSGESSGSGSETDEVVETVAALLQQNVPIRISAQTAAEIRGAVELAREFDLQIVLDDCRGLEPFHSQLADWKPHVRGVILPGTTPGQIANPSAAELESRIAPWEHARELLDAGIPVAIRSNSDADLTQMFFVAGQFMQDELTAVELLAAVTSAPASLMKVADQVGVLAKGRRANFVVLNGQPFQLHTKVQATYVSGKAQFERQQDKATTVVQAARVYLGDGKYLDDASVVVKGSTVRDIGSGVSAPDNADVRMFEDAVIVPGFVDMGTGLGLGGPLSGNIRLQTKLGEQLYADDPAIAYARKSGITTALLAQSSAQATPVVAFKLGPDARVLGDPVAIRFRLNGDTAAGITSNERLLKAGKAYADSWTKYEKDLADYQVKLKAWESENKKSGSSDKAKANADKKDADKKSDDKKSDEKKKPAGDDKGTDKKKDEKRDEKDKPKDDDDEAATDPITGTWEGTLESERLPAQARAFKFELVLEGDSVSGSVTMLRNTTDISEGSYNRESRELVITISRRGSAVEISGSLDDDGKFTGSFDLGRMGAVEMTATRTEDKSKKPEPKPEDKDKPKDEEKKEDKKEKPAEGEDKPEEKKDKPEDKEDKSDEKADKSDDADKKKDDSKEDKDAAKAKEADSKSAEKPKEPRKPRANPALEPYRALFASKIPALVESRDSNSIKAAAELFSKQYKLRTVIVGADDLSRQPDLLDDYSVSVCVGPQLSVNVDSQPRNLPQLLANEQLQFGFQSSGTTGSGMLPSAIQFSVSRGLSATDALEGLAANPAKMLSEDMNFGQLASGKDADLVILSGAPFEYSTKVLAVMIDGVWVYEHEEIK